MLIFEIKDCGGKIDKMKSWKTQLYNGPEFRDKMNNLAASCGVSSGKILSEASFGVGNPEIAFGCAKSSRIKLRSARLLYLDITEGSQVTT